MELETPHVLIVDDEIFNLEFLTDLLSDDYDVTPVKDGEKALQLVETLLPDLIILDVIMGGMDGFDVIQALKGNPKTCHIPIVFLTGLNSSQDEEKGLSLGAVDYISKPLRPTIIKSRVNNILELVQHRKLLERLAMLDGLTGIPNRRAYDERLVDEWKRCVRSGEPLSVAFLDVDHFKLYNDSYGHPAGDLVLKKVAQTFTLPLKRSSDFGGRYGGEEFAMILPSTPMEGARVVAEEICREVRQLAIEHKASTGERVVTVSIGGATTVPKHGARLSDFTEHVDKMLYRAKAARNSVVWEAFAPSD